MKLTFLILFNYLAITGFSQTLNSENQLAITLSDKQNVVVILAEDCSQCYYYLPMNFRLSAKQDKHPEISFTSWKNDEESEVIGAIFHYLTVWGLTPLQEKELQQKLNNRLDTTAFILGAAAVKVDTGAMYLYFTGDAKQINLMNEAATNSAQIATTPGSKMAQSFRFDKENVNTIIDLIENPKKIKLDLNISFSAELKKSHGIVEQKITLTLSMKKLFSYLKE